ncbi:MAG: hypothetical protein MUD01_00505 [Chloroflexaceae bacterium]|jgi:dipeptidyl aminopeptidase/acylaminoacyl peptidase|nr:hypothetical protein [Chloroflexaceae bacterium]
MKRLFILILLLVACGGTAAPAMQPGEGPGGASSLAFIREGDLTVLPLPMGQARRLTTGGGASQPRWSPSGAWLSYCGGGQAHIISADGGEARPVGACPASWAPRDDTLLSGGDDGTLRLTTAGTWQERTLPGQLPALWNADGSAIAFVYTPDAPGAAWPPAVSLRRVSRDGSDLRTLYSPPTDPPMGLVPAAWVGDHVLLWEQPAFAASILADGTALQVVPASGGPARVLSPAMLARPDFLAPAPDGRSLILVEGEGRDLWRNKRLSRIDLHSGQRTTLTKDGTVALWPAWSPDGVRIAYVAAPEPGPPASNASELLAQRRIWVMDADGSRPRFLSNNPAYRDERPRWTRDGRWLVFPRVDSQGRASLWASDGAGDEPRLLMSDLQQPTVTPLDSPADTAWDAVFDVR